MAGKKNLNFHRIVLQKMVFKRWSLSQRKVSKIIFDVSGVINSGFSQKLDGFGD
jgi:hypothetical protein